MSDPFRTATVDTLLHYLNQIDHLLSRIKAADNPRALLALRLAPDMFDTGFNLAVALQFAARALCLPMGTPLPPIPEPQTLDALTRYKAELTEMLTNLDLSQLHPQVLHRAGEANLTQSTPDYITRFALPNMIFHITLAYAALRQAGLPIGKADFDALHFYTS